MDTVPPSPRIYLAGDERSQMSTSETSPLTDAPSPTEDAPAAGWYPDPAGSGQQRYWDGTQWAPNAAPPPTRGRGRSPAVVGLVATIIGLAIVGAVVFLAYLQPRSEAKDVLREARPLVQRSLVISRRARQDVVRYMRTGDAPVRRRAVREINQMIELRRRAIAGLGDMDEVGFPGDKNFKRAAAVWAGTMRDSLRPARGLRASLPTRISPGSLERRADATFVVTQALDLEQYDRLIRKTDREIIDELL